MKERLVKVVIGVVFWIVSMMIFWAFVYFALLAGAAGV